MLMWYDPPAITLPFLGFVCPNLAWRNSKQKGCAIFMSYSVIHPQVLPFTSHSWRRYFYRSTLLGLIKLITKLFLPCLIQFSCFHNHAVADAWAGLESLMNVCCAILHHVTRVRPIVWVIYCKVERASTLLGCFCGNCLNNVILWSHFRLMSRTG